jgi:hypothetical protein
VIWILAVGGALAVVTLGAFAFLVIGVQATDRHKSLLGTSDNSAARSFARRVLGVYVRQQARTPGRGEVRK